MNETSLYLDSYKRIARLLEVLDEFPLNKFPTTEEFITETEMKIEALLFAFNASEEVSEILQSIKKRKNCI